MAAFACALCLALSMEEPVRACQCVGVDMKTWFAESGGNMDTLFVGYVEVVHRGEGARALVADVRLQDACGTGSVGDHVRVQERYGDCYAGILEQEGIFWVVASKGVYGGDPFRVLPCQPFGVESFCDERQEEVSATSAGCASCSAVPMRGGNVNAFLLSTAWFAAVFGARRRRRPAPLRAS